MASVAGCTFQGQVRDNRGRESLHGEKKPHANCSDPIFIITPSLATPGIQQVTFISKRWHVGVLRSKDLHSKAGRQTK